jgi:hypothetical protein
MTYFWSRIVVILVVISDTRSTIPCGTVGTPPGSTEVLRTLEGLPL